MRKSMPYLCCLFIATLAQPGHAVDRAWLAGDDNWSSAAHWNPFGVPGSTDEAFIGNMPSAEGAEVTLDQHDTVAGLHLLNLADLNTGGYGLLVQGAVTVDGGATVFGNSSVLRVTHSPTAPRELDADDMLLTNGGVLSLSEGSVTEIDQQLIIDEQGILIGSDSSVLQLQGNFGPALINNGTIDGYFDGGLIINQLGNGRIDLDGSNEEGILTANYSNIPGTEQSTLTVNGDQLVDPFDGRINIAQSGTVNMNITNGWEVGPGGVIFFHENNGGPVPALNGSEMTLNGEVRVGGSDSGYINADTIINSGAQIQMYTNGTLRFWGDAVINGGTFALEEGADLYLHGPTELAGGNFSTFSDAPADGAVWFQGETNWSGDVQFVGAAVQNGDATVSQATQIDADLFDMDGLFGDAAWDVNAAATVNAASIDVGNNLFNGTISVNGVLQPSSHLAIQLNDPGHAWSMQGIMNLNGAMGVNRLSGSAVTMSGILNIAGDVGIASNTVFQSGNAVNLWNGFDQLRMRGTTRVESGATFAGLGALINDAVGVMVLDHGAIVNVDLENEGHLQIGDGPGGVVVDRFQPKAGSVTEFFLNGLMAGTEYSQLEATANIVVEGGTFEITPLAGYADPAVPGTLDEFLLMSANIITGDFDQFIYDDQTLIADFVAGNARRTHVGEGLFRIVEQSSAELRLQNYRALMGDANGDGTVDGQDFLIWNEHKFTEGTDWTTGDFNGDGTTDGQDYVLWNQNKFSSVDAFSLTSVPEPTSASLLLIGILAFRPRQVRAC
ncbi:MAG: dockerin type I domain-containing protein [Planctomycetota bacterium]